MKDARHARKALGTSAGITPRLPAASPHRAASAPPAGPLCVAPARRRAPPPTGRQALCAIWHSVKADTQRRPRSSEIRVFRCGFFVRPCGGTIDPSHGIPSPSHGIPSPSHGSADPSHGNSVPRPVFGGKLGCICDTWWQNSAPTAPLRRDLAAICLKMRCF